MHRKGESHIFTWILDSFFSELIFNKSWVSVLRDLRAYACASGGSSGAIQRLTCECSDGTSVDVGRIPEGRKTQYHSEHRIKRVRAAIGLGTIA